MKPFTTLLFVYNADSGRANAAFDVAHKLLSPSSYPCQLCQLTHGVFSEKKVWKTFREEFEGELIFLHRDEVEKQFDMITDYPVVMKKTEDVFQILFSNEELNRFKDVEELIQQILSKTA